MGVIQAIRDSIRHGISGRWSTVVTYLTGKRIDAPTMPTGEQLEQYRHWVYVCTTKIGTVVGAAVYEITDQAGQPASGPLADLLASPNPAYSTGDFLGRTQLHLDLTGNAYWLLVKNPAGVVKEMWLLRPDLVSVTLNEDGLLQGYLYGNADNPRAYLPEEIVHFKYVNPLSDWLGLSPIEANSLAVSTDHNMRTYQDAFFQNSARHDFLVVSKQKLHQTTIDRFYEKWEGRHRGAENAYRPLILSGAEYEVKPLTGLQKDFAFPQLADWSRDNILAIYGVPASIAGIERGVNRATAFQSDISFQRDTIQPRLRRIAGTINHQLVPIVQPGAELIFADTVPSDREFALQQETARLTSGVITVNEVREGLGLDPVEWGDEPRYLQTSPGPALFSAPMATPTPPPAQTAEHAADPGPDGEQDSYEYWRGYVVEHASAEKTLRKDIAEAFQKDQEEIIRRVKERIPTIKDEFRQWHPRKLVRWIKKHGQMDDMFPGDDEWRRWWRDALKRAIASIIEKFGAEAIGEAEDIVAAGLAIDWDLSLPEVEEYVNDLLDKIAKNVVDTTKTKLTDQIGEDIAAGKGVDIIAEGIEETIGSWVEEPKGRAYRIARTEATRASNGAKSTAWQKYQKESNVLLSKVWRSAQDERTRSTAEGDEFDHLGANGETVPIEDRFQSTGEPMEAPGDLAGSAGNVINCRCTMSLTRRQ